MATRRVSLRRVVSVTVVVPLMVALLVSLPHAPAAAESGAIDVREAQTLLDSLGYPVGPIDGIDGPQTRRGWCAWRRLEGLDVHRGPATAEEIEKLRASIEFPVAAEGRGVTVDKTCQTIYFRQGERWERVFAASTGRRGLPRQGDYAITRTRSGWHTSTLYPSPTPNMYNTMYFSGVIAIHGSHHVPTYPASAGCVRVTPSTADYLYQRLARGDSVQVVGDY